MNDKDLEFKDYLIETETSDYKRRVCIYMKSGIQYTRREDLEGRKNHIVIIDINVTSFSSISYCSNSDYWI